MAGEFALGTPVMCLSGATGDAYGCSNEIGLVLESRRKHSRVFFAYNARVYWVPSVELRRVKPEAMRDRPRERRIVWLIEKLGAVEATIEKFAADSVVVEMFHGAVNADLLDAVRREMGIAIVSWTLNPGGQSKIASVIEFR